MVERKPASKLIVRSEAREGEASYDAGKRPRRRPRTLD